MDASDIAHHRLHNQRIAAVQPAFAYPSEVVAWLGAMQAQDYAGALWSVGLRLPCATVVDIERAIAERTIVRTWPLRGTLHFVAAADVRWMLRLLTPRIIAGSARRHQQLELDDTAFARSADAFTRALQGGRQLTREAMYRVLEEAGISPAGQRGYHILGRLAQEGLICFGPKQGKQQTFVLLDEWVPASASLSREEALVELARRYFTSHGPATVQDFTWWSGLAAADARAGTELVESELTQERAEGQTYYMSPAAAVSRDHACTAFLLPGFDEYLLGYRDRSVVLDQRHSHYIVPGGNGVFNPTIVVDGKVAGTWKRMLKKNTLDVEPRYFSTMNAAQQGGVAAAINRYREFVSLPPG